MYNQIKAVYCSETFILFWAVAPNLTVKENLELMCGVHGFPREKRNRKVEELTKQFELAQISSGVAFELPPLVCSSWFCDCNAVYLAFIPSYPSVSTLLRYSAFLKIWKRYRRRF